jgi:hypothetical protein
MMMAQSRDDDDISNSGGIKPITVFSVMIAIVGLLLTIAIQPLHNEIGKIELNADYLKAKTDRHMEDGHSVNCVKIERRVEQLEQILYQRGNEK